MAIPNPENLNIRNEGIPEEDPHHLLDYDEEEDPEMDIEKEEPEKDLPGNMNGWVDDDDDDVEEEEVEENEDADMEEDDCKTHMKNNINLKFLQVLNHDKKSCMI
nr:hypothetical protein [Tanacetum cinerariifolium]